MSNTLSHRDYHGSVEYSAEDGVLFGRLLGIRALVSYEAEDVKQLRQAFEAAVDDYLAFCTETGKTPEKPFKGSFNVRPGPDLHREAALLAMRRGTNLNAIVTEALTNLVRGAK